MSVLSRGFAHLRQHGFGSTLRKAGTALRQAAYFGKHVLFACDLPTRPPQSADGDLEVERVSAFDRQKIDKVISHWDSETMLRSTQQRFAIGAQLWLARLRGEIAGYGWSLRFFCLSRISGHPAQCTARRGNPATRLRRGGPPSADRVCRMERCPASFACADAVRAHWLSTPDSARTLGHLALDGVAPPP
jgi:hypothetical protein